jgi:hypothetical protein
LTARRSQIRLRLDSRAGAGWSTGGVRILAAVLAAFQVMQGIYDPVLIGNVRFTESYYLVTYNHGFVRRGLLGEGLRLLMGVPSRSEVDVVADIVAALGVVAVLVLIEVLVRWGSAASCSMAIILAASPFTIDYLIVDRRPDLLGLVALVGLGFIVTRGTPALMPWLTVIGLVLAGLVLIHEDLVLIQIPWAIVLVTAATLRDDGVLVGRNGPGVARALAARLSLLLFPPAVATLMLLAYGLPGTKKVSELEADVSSFHLEGNSVFTYLPDSIRASVRLVDSIPEAAKTQTLFLASVLILLQLISILRCGGPRFWTPFLRHGNRGLGICLGVTVAVATVVLFATGFDWLRWLANCGSAWLIVQSFSVLLLEPADDRVDVVRAGSPDDGERAVDQAGPNAGRIHLPRWLPAVAVYLAAIPPLDTLTAIGRLRHFLFFV